MNRKKLGEELCNWHSSMGDPIYAVGSFYLSDSVYPNPLIVRDAIHSLEHTLQEDKDMLEGKPVMVVRQEKTVDLKEFAGYNNEELQDNINQLTELIAALRFQFKEDLRKHDIVDGWRKAHCVFDAGNALDDSPMISIYTFYQSAYNGEPIWKKTGVCDLTMKMFEKVAEWTELAKEFCK